MHQRQVARVFQVDAPAFFAYVLLQKIAALVMDAIRMLPAGVACFRALDLNHISTQRSAAAAQIRPGQKMAVVDDAKGGKRQILCFLHGFYNKIGF